MPRRLIMCCDGTWNTAGQRCPTNVPRFRDAIAPRAADGSEQRVFYHEGVGTGRWERIRGGAFGFGLSRIVRDTYQFVVENYEAGDELFFVGFSRGAFTARSTVGLVRNAGILRRNHASRIDQAYALYRNDAGPDSPEAKAFRAAYAVADRVFVRFIGVWDTVGALGVPSVGLPGTNFLNRRWAFHDTKLSSTVQSAFQALAIDEARRPFEPTLWEPQPHADRQDLEQVWFVGGHCDVGGGYDDRELADVTFYWMTSRAHACGLEFKHALAPLGADLAMGPLHDSRTGLYRLLPPSPRRLGAKDPEHEYAAATAVERRKKGPYAPQNLTEYLDGTHQELPI
jgi:uncharacterized protein (DUF2235 family)